MTLALVPAPPPAGPIYDQAAERRKVSLLHQLSQGKMNCVGTVTLGANVASTTVSDPRVTAQSVILLMPTTANAGTEYGAGAWRIGTRTQGVSFVITHANNAQADRTFAYAIIG